MAKRKLKMQTVRLEMGGKQVTVGVLRKFTDKERVPLLDSLGLIKAVNAKYKTSLRLLRPHVADFLLNATPYWRKVREAFPSPVGTLIGYEYPGMELVEEIVYDAEGGPRVILPTGRFRGERGVALVVLDMSADDIKKDGKDIRIDVHDSRLIRIPLFPPADGWYMPHAETTVPHRKKVKASGGARYLYRKNDGSYVGLLAYSCDDSGYGYRQNVYAYRRPSDGFGVAVEVPEKDLAKIEAPA